LTGTGKITGLTINRPTTDYVGLFGNTTGTLTQIALTGTVSGQDYVGGLFGRNAGTVTDSYSTVAVTASANDKIRGGLGGHNHQGIVRRSYSIGAVLPIDGSNGGGFIGTKDTGGSYEDTNNFYDTETSGWATSVMGTGKTTAQMRDINTFTGWDIVLIKAYTDQIWKIDSGRRYPMLGWEVFFIGILPLFRPKKGG